MLRIAFQGAGTRAEGWRRALSACPEVSLAPGAPLEGVDAVVITSGVGDPWARAREALRAGRPVLYAAPFLLSPWQAGGLRELAGRQGCLLRFAEPFQHRAGFAFVRRLLQGDQPFWRPLYLRLLHLAVPDEALRLDERATEELARCDLLLGGAPQQASAAASRHPDSGEARAVFLTLQYQPSTVVDCTVSLAEGGWAQQLVAVTPQRTIVVDDLDATTPVRILPGEGASSRHEPHDRDAARDAHPLEQEARRFVQAALRGDLSCANGDRWMRVACVWQAARQSMNAGGVPVVVSMPVAEGAETGPPPLRVIEGGGKATRAARQRPWLTVVAR